MEIDWNSIPFEISYLPEDLQHNSTLNTDGKSLTSNNEELMDTENGAGSNDTTMSATEISHIVEIDNVIVINTDDLIVEERFSDDENSYNRQRNIEIPPNSTSVDEIVRCFTCSLDLPSLAYYKRHLNTKKHERALRMEMRGRKVNQKKRYVRKNERNETIPPSSSTTAATKKTANITDLTTEEVEMLQMFDDQIQTIQNDTSAKDFYENFDFSLDFVEENVGGIDLASQNEILADLIASSEQFEVNKADPSVMTPEIVVATSAPINTNNNKNQQKPLTPTFQNLQNILTNLHQAKSQPKVTTPMNAPQHHCQLCDKFFSKQCHFTQHMNSAHTNNRRFRCGRCGKKYAKSEQLEQHKLRHNENKPFKCEQCERSYNNKIDLKRHEKMHSDVRQHNCEICGRGFVRYDHLLKHYQVHQKRVRVEVGRA